MKLQYRASIVLFLILLSNYSQSQTGDDGWNNRTLFNYSQQEEVARVSVTLKPDLQTNNQYLHVYIDPDLAYNGGEVITNGEFNFNYIRIYTPKGDNSTTSIPVHGSIDYAKWFESINYYDGLGRLMQKSEVSSMPNGSDLITPVKYNSAGLQENNYMAYCLIQDGANGPGGYRSNDLDEQLQFNEYFFVNEGEYAKSKVKYEGSPLARVIKEYPQGAAWQTLASEKPISTFYETNSDNELSKLIVTASGELKKDGLYASGKLFKVKKYDENQNESIQYTDFDGKVIAIKTGGSINCITYYVYDDYGLLRYVLPPKASDNVPLDNTTYYVYDLNTVWVKDYCFYYNYDIKKRLIEKKMPGVNPEYYVYNNRDLLILSQDGNERAKKQWKFYKYDKMNRQILSGIYTDLTLLTRSQLQDAVNNNSILYEEFNVTNAVHGYSSLSFPTNLNSCEVQTVNYYDDNLYQQVAVNSGDYSFRANELVFTNGNSVKTKGMVTGTKVQILGHDNIEINDTWILTANWYDKYGRLIQSISDSPEMGKIISSNLYNFTGQLLKSKENHENCLAGNVSIVQRNEYDNGARPIKSYVSVANNAEVQVSEMVYDEIGQIKAKKLHCNVDQSAQTLDYKYNIRGWLEKINDPLTLNNDMFAMELRYTSGQYPGYNGNISEIVWSSTQFKDVKKYTFQYDGLNRLLNSNYVGNGNFNECLTYDKNGNILTLSRNGYIGTGFGTIDNLTYTYTGNQIKAINDDQNSNNQNNGFTDNGFFSNQEYTHDVSGNLISDLNKQISSIGYNHLNQPEKIEINASQPQIILNLYDAAGTKIKKETRVNQSVLNTTFYEGSFVYENDQLAYILMPEGRISLENNVYSYEYFIKDHLGNTRIVFNQFKSLLQDYSYYPFGMTMASLDYDKFNQSSINKLLYNGKELQEDFNLNWYDYGARFYDAVIGRWHSVDPHAEKYASWSPYSYVYDNPINGIDPDGRDGIIIVFPNYKVDTEVKVGKWKAPKVPLGHAGVLTIDKKGRTRYYEYGRYPTTDGTKGRVRRLSVSDVKIGSDGKPTNESLNKVMGQISKKSGQGGEIRGAYVVSDKTEEMNNYAQQKLNESNPGNTEYNKDREPYNVKSNNCGTFAADVVNQDESVDQPTIINPTPNNIVDEYIEEGNAEVNYNPTTNTTTVGQGDESDAKKLK